ncbi:sodium:solute symporter family protein [Natroniella acetigena]|uniref:sodium:solute symporter family protein n=1 Tax=Natroniella acetigena TaxID=52004 RepID=UPI00200B41A0|nr:sodium:solute symporter family protein [Natroniella acetigena]MCK8827277.1 sodium:solute symporter family protein [Natroniella acetigena]
MLTVNHFIGMAITLLGVTVVSIFSLQKVESSADFILAGRKAGATLVAGTILGTLLGGASTIGTAQLAYESGLSGIGFTLGGGLGCIILGLFFTKKLRGSEVETGPQFLAKTFGVKAGFLASIFISLGTFINVIGNTLAAIALLTSILGLSPLIAMFLMVILAAVHILCGGIWGSSLVGVLKVILLYIALIFSSVIAFSSIGGFSGLGSELNIVPFYGVFERGITNDLAAVLAVVIGFLSTQTYLQAVFMGRDARVSRNGAIISGCLMIPVGLMATVVGLYMRGNYPNINSSQALPIFILEHFPPLLSGIILAILLVTVTATIGGLTLGISTTLSQDVYRKLINSEVSDRKILLISRLLTLIIMLLNLGFVMTNLGSVIMEWSYLSMTLRGTTMFLPLIAAVFFSSRVSSQAGFWSVFLAPSISLGWAIINGEGINPLYIGLVVGFLILGSSLLRSNKDSKIFS